MIVAQGVRSFSSSIRLLISERFVSDYDQNWRLYATGWVDSPEDCAIDGRRAWGRCIRSEIRLAAERWTFTCSIG